MILILLLLAESGIQGQTAVAEGTVSGRWDLSGSPYLIWGDLTIPDGTILVIDPGVVVEFQGYYSLQVQGCLRALGTESDSILFTVQDTTGFSDPDTMLGAWNGIRFTDTPTGNDSSKLVHCCIEYSKAVGPVWHLNAGGAISVLQFGKISIQDCLIRNNCAGGRTDHPPIGGGLYLFGSDVVVRNTVFQNNTARLGGAVFMDDSDPVFEGNLFTGNRALEGGGISLGGTSHPVFYGDRFIGNTAVNLGGGLFFREPCRVTCLDATFSENRADWGGGIGTMGGILEASGCQFTENGAVRWGGGVAGDFASVKLEGCTFTGDSCSWGSGGLHLDNAVAEITGCTFWENSAFFGAAMHAVFSQVTVRNTHFAGNEAQSAGAVHLESSDCIMEHCSFSQNHALSGPGGAVEYLADTTLFSRPLVCSLYACAFEENTAFQHSGAMRIHQSSEGSSIVQVHIDSTLFLDNHADVYGSFRINGPISGFLVSRCIFQGNTSARYVAGAGFIGGAQGRVENTLFNSNYTGFDGTSGTAHGSSLGSGATVTFLHCTFANSSGPEGNGLSVRRGSKATLFNSVLWGCGNRPVSVVTAAEEGSTVELYHCCVEYGMDSVFVSDSASSLVWGAGNIREDPDFADMPGGNFRLADTSPCIGAGMPEPSAGDGVLQIPAVDLDGHPRPLPVGSDPDLGAYEHVLGFPVGVIETNSEAPSGCTLLPNFPNPFAQNTLIRYHLSRPCQVVIGIYTLQGQQAAVLVAENRPAGDHTLEWNGKGLEAGCYICRMETDRGERAAIRLMKIQ